MSNLLFADRIAQIAGLEFDEPVSVRFENAKGAEAFVRLIQAGLIEHWEQAADYLEDRHDLEKLAEAHERMQQSESTPYDGSVTELLGFYRPGDQTIVIYENLCQLAARRLGVKPDILINVVLAHEEAHAVTHLGVDDCGEIWKCFASAPDLETELYAQLYPYLVFDKMSPEREAFLRLNDRQSSVYRQWEGKKDLDLQTINEEFYRIRHEVHPLTEVPEPSTAQQAAHICVAAIFSSDGTVGGLPDSKTVGAYNVLDGGVPGKCRPLLVVRVELQDNAEIQILRAFKHVTLVCPNTRHVVFLASHWDAIAWQRHKDAFKTMTVDLKMPGIVLLSLNKFSTAQLESAMDRFNRARHNGLICHGISEVFRQIIPAGWDEKGVHYEFLVYRQEKKLGVEIHLELKRATHLQTFLRDYALQKAAIQGAQVSYDAKWANGNGRLRCLFPFGTSPDELAAAMNELIDDTCELISAML